MTDIPYSDKMEEVRIFNEIMKLMPSFRDVVVACSEHERALLNLIKMVGAYIPSLRLFIMFFT